MHPRNYASIQIHINESQIDCDLFQIDGATYALHGAINSQYFECLLQYHQQNYYNV